MGKGLNLVATVFPSPPPPSPTLWERGGSGRWPGVPPPSSPVVERGRGSLALRRGGRASWPAFPGGAWERGSPGNSVFYRVRVRGWEVVGFSRSSIFPRSQAEAWECLSRSSGSKSKEGGQSLPACIPGRSLGTRELAPLSHSVGEGPGVRAKTSTKLTLQSTIRFNEIKVS